MNERNHPIRIALFITLGIFLFGQVTPVTAAPPADAPLPLINDALPQPPIPSHRLVEEKGPVGMNVAGTPDLPGYYDTSVYMAGTVAVGLVLPESNGAIDANTENWTSAEMAEVLNEVQTALDWYESQAPASSHLNFVIDSAGPQVVPTSYEPINRAQVHEGVWIGDTLAHMGYSTGDYFWDRSYAYLNDLRDRNHADWAFIIFVADSSNDPDGYFSSGYYFAYSYLGGPFFIMTYDNGEWGIENMHQVAAHETGHIFLAADQYVGSGCLKTQRHGYLGVLNSWCADTHPSIMKTNYTLSNDDPARGQIGWRDSDGDGVIDPVDTSPTVTLPAHVPDPTTQTSLTYSGNVEVNPYPRYSGCTRPYCWDKDITLQNVSEMAYQLDGGVWQGLSPSDGIFDEQIEEFVFTVDALADGDHTITARGTSAFSRNGGVPTTASATASDPITIGIANLPGVGVHDDTHSGWTYITTWPSYNASSAYGGKYRYSSRVGNSASFSFVGTKFSLIYESYRLFGNLDIFVDDAWVTTLSQNSTQMLWQQKYTSPSYEYGVHTVRFVHASGTRVNVDAIRIFGLPDLDQPAAITDLTASPGPSNGSVTLNWSAPAEDASLGTGTASAYLVGYSLNPIDSGNWDAATAVTNGIPILGAPGTSQQMTVSGLAPGVNYYFAVRAQDDEPNLGGMSNAPVLVSATSPAPAGAGKYDDKDAHWVFNGSWLNLPNLKAYSSSLKYTSVVHNSAAFVFTGTNFILGYAVSLVHGELDVYVDGVYVTTINQKASPAALRTYTLDTALTAGQHTVQFVNRNGKRVTIDSIEILP